jgi:hypothetical protein
MSSTPGIASAASTAALWNGWFWPGIGVQGRAAAVHPENHIRTFRP